MTQSSNHIFSRFYVSRSYPILVITLAAFFLFYKYIMQVSPSIMTRDLMRAFHVQGFGLGNLAATFFYAYMVTQIFVGVLLDKFSTKWLTSAAILVAGIGTIAFANAYTLHAAILARLLMGVGAAFATVAYMKFAAVWFEPKHFAFVAGLLATAAMTGAVFGEAPLAYLVSDVGWRSALMTCGVAGVVLAGLFMLLVTDRPQDLGQAGTLPPLCFKDVLQVLKEKDNWLLTFYSGLAFSPVAVFGGLWGNPFLEEAYHISRTTAATAVSFCFIGLAIGGPALGWFSDRLGKRRPVMIAGTILSLVTMSAVIYVNTLPLWVVSGLLFFFGFGTGAFMLGFAIGKELNPPIVAATVIALINTGDALFGAVTEPLVGKLLDLQWTGVVVDGVNYFSVANFHASLIVLPIYLLLAMCLAFLVKETQALSP